MKTLLRGVAQHLFVIAALSFFVGGRAIGTFTKTERVLAAMEGIALAVVRGALGALAKSAGDNLDDGEDSEKVAVLNVGRCRLVPRNRTEEIRLQLPSFSPSQQRCVPKLQLHRTIRRVHSKGNSVLGSRYP